MKFQSILKERADALLDKIPALERALGEAAGLDAALTAIMNDFSELFREFRALEKTIGPPVRDTGTEMVVREVVRRLEWMEGVWRRLAEKALAERKNPGAPDGERIGCGCVAGKRLSDLTLRDWVAPELLAVFDAANGGGLGCFDFHALDGGAEAALPQVWRHLQPDAASPRDDVYYALNLTLDGRSSGDGPERHHIIVIDRVEILRDNLEAIFRDEILPLEYEFTLTFAVSGRGNHHEAVLETISTGTLDDPLGFHKKKGVTSATFRRFVDILAGFYPGVIATCAVSPVTEHWFKKYFNAVLLNAEKENVFKGIIPEPRLDGMDGRTQFAKTG